MFQYIAMAMIGLCLFILGYMMGLDKGFLKARKLFQKPKINHKQSDTLKIKRSSFSPKKRALRLVKTNHHDNTRE